MAKQFADFIQGRTVPNHARCQTVAEEVSTLACGLHSRSVECTPNQVQIDCEPANSRRGALSRMNTLRQEQLGRPWRRYSARASPTSLGNGS